MYEDGQGNSGLAIVDVDQESLASIAAPDSPRGYRRVTLSRDEQLELAAARWVAGGQSALHGHGQSAATYAVMSGVVEDERYIPDGAGYRCESVILRAGDRGFLPAGSYHRVRALDNAVTVHAYCPPPEDATEAVPQELRQQFRLARRRACTERDEGHRRSTSIRLARPNLVETVRALLDTWAEREAQANQLGQLRLPPDTLAELRSSGILTAPLPEHLGGWDASLSDAVAALRLVGQRAPATALALVMPLGNAATTRIPELALPRELRRSLIEGQRWIADQVHRGMILAVANSEPGAGGDLANTKTTAEADAHGVYHLEGRKSFATFGRDADYFLCAARRQAYPGEKSATVVDGFFVARGAAGLDIDDRWNPVGMRPTASVGLTLKRTPAEAILGFPGCLEGVNARHWSTVLFAAAFLGVGEGALREGVKQCTGSSWGQATLADNALALDAAAGFVENVAHRERWPMTADLQEQTRRAKTFAAKTAVETALHAAMVSGGRSYTPDHPVFRFLCDALAGPLLRPPLPQAMDSIIKKMFAAGSN